MGRGPVSQTLPRELDDGALRRRSGHRALPREAGGTRALAVALAALAAAGVVSGCGGAEQDANEPRAHIPVEVVSASFPTQQAVSRPTVMQLIVKNTGSTIAPDLAVTVDSFYYKSNYPELADRRRPAWILDNGPGQLPPRAVKTDSVDPPGSGETAYVNTWALGPLAADTSEEFTWHVTPVKAGHYVVHYTIAAGLNGKAQAEPGGSGTPAGTFVVNIAPKPPSRYVDPSTGRLVIGPASAATKAGVVALP